MAQAARAAGPQRPAPKLLLVTPATEPSLDLRILGALRCLYSLSRDAEGREIVWRLAEEYRLVSRVPSAGLGAAAPPRAKDSVMAKLDAIRSKAAQLDRIPMSPTVGQGLRAIARLADDAIGECVGVKP